MVEHLGSPLCMGLLQIAPMILMALIVTPASFLFILCHQAVRGFSRIIISDRILTYTYADKRATILSIGALSGRLFFAVTDVSELQRQSLELPTSDYLGPCGNTSERQ